MWSANKRQLKTHLSPRRRFKRKQMLEIRKNPDDIELLGMDFKLIVYLTGRLTLIYLMFGGFQRL